MTLNILRGFRLDYSGSKRCLFERVVIYANFLHRPFRWFSSGNVQQDASSESKK